VEAFRAREKLVRAGHVGFLLGCRKHIQHQNITWPTTPILNS